MTTVNTKPFTVDHNSEYFDILQRGIQEIAKTLGCGSRWVHPHRTCMSPMLLHDNLVSDPQ